MEKRFSFTDNPLVYVQHLLHSCSYFSVDRRHFALLFTFETPADMFSALGDIRGFLDSHIPYSYSGALFGRCVLRVPLADWLARYWTAISGEPLSFVK